MPDSKITALASIGTGTDPVNDALVIVDVSDVSPGGMSATGTTKRVSLNNLLASSPTATLASATITGDLTVDTSTLKVDSANDRVGIGTATPAAGYKLDVRGNVSGGNGTIFGGITFSSRSEIGSFTNHDCGFMANSVTQYLIGVGGNHTWYNSGSTAMTLNATGLGVGIVPSSFGRFSVQGTAGGAGILGMNTDATQCDIQSYNKPLALNRAGNNITMCEGGGNVGIGVAPSAWKTNFKALQFGPYSVGYGSIYTDDAGNTWFNSLNFQSATTRQYVANGNAAAYRLTQNGQHQWYTDSVGGVAAGTVSFTQAMTLDASGNLLVGKTASGFTVAGAEIRSNGEVLQTIAASTDATIVSKVYSSTAAAYRFYVGLGGTVFATNTTISAISDARLKENVQDIDVGLGAILALKPRKFDWKEGKGKNIKGDRGFIAQEFEQVFPQLVDKWADESPEGEAPYKSVRQDLIPVLVKAIQELTARVQTLETR